MSAASCVLRLSVSSFFLIFLFSFFSLSSSFSSVTSSPLRSVSPSFFFSFSPSFCCFLRLSRWKHHSFLVRNVWIYVYIHCSQLKWIVCILDELQTCVGVLLVMVSCTSMCFIYVCLCCDTFSLASSSISPSLSSLMDATISECLLTVFSMYRCPSSAPKTHTDTHMVTYHGGLGFVMIWYDLVTNNLSEGFMYILIGMITCI